MYRTLVSKEVKSNSDSDDGASDNSLGRFHFFDSLGGLIAERCSLWEDVPADLESSTLDPFQIEPHLITIREWGSRAEQAVIARGLILLVNFNYNNI